MGERNSSALRHRSFYREQLPLVVGLIPLASFFFASFFFVTPSAHAQSEDGIAWLQKDMSCDELTVEMRKRYAKVGNFNSLGEDKRQEIGLVLDIICGARFAKCGFKNCQKLAPLAQAERPAEPKPSLEPLAETATPVPATAADPVASAPVATIPVSVPSIAPLPPVDFQAEARRQLDERVEKQRQYIRDRIAQAQARENSEKRGWVKVSVESDAEVAPDGAEDGDSEDATAPAEDRKSPVPAPRAATKSESSNTQIAKLDVAPARYEQTRRPRMNPEFAPVSPATPMVDLPLPGTLGRTTGKFLPKSSPEFHKARPPANLPFELKAH